MRNVALQVILSFAIAAVLLAPGAVHGQSTEESLQGAWRVVRIGDGRAPGGAPRWTPNGLLLFAGDHYSYTLVTRPRPEMPRRMAAPEELVRVWNPFTANAGSFEISGDTMTRRPAVAKNPDAMGPGLFNRYTFRIRADTLWTTTVGTETGPATNPTTVRYERVR